MFASRLTTPLIHFTRLLLADFDAASINDKWQLQLCSEGLMGLSLVRGKKLPRRTRLVYASLGS